MDNARIAVALERYWLEHQRYPESLAALSPDFLDRVPPDSITDRERIYEVKADGRPAIYSLGSNKVDDGGTPRSDLKFGDWVWQYSLPEGVDYETYKSRE